MTRPGQVVAALVLVLGAVAGIVGAARLSIGSVHQPGPGFFPLALAAALLLVSLALVAQALGKGSAPRRAPAGPGGSRARGKAVAVVSALFLYGFVMDRIGFTAATFLLLVFLFLVVEPTRWLIAVGGSALTAMVCWVVFKLWLGVQLPAGPWGF